MHTSLVLTHDCNLACTYCYTGEKFRTAMTWETARAGIDLAFGAADEVDLGFFGGEPLMAFDMLVRVAETARARAVREGRRLRLQVTTNGTLLTPERAQRLRTLEVQVTLSLDGTREAHEATRPQRGGRSSFDRAMQGVEALREGGVPLDVIAVVAPANVRHLGATVRFLEGLGARQIILNPCFEATWGDDDLVAWEKGLNDAAETYAARMRSGRPLAMPTFDNKILAATKGGLAACDTCSSGEREVAVAPSGNLYPCARLVNEDRDPRWVIGHVSRGIDRAAVRAIARGPSDAACEPCAERWRCGASCMCANLAETGTPNLPGGVQCWYEQTTARIADATAHALLDARCAAFVAWTYGRVAAAHPDPEVTGAVPLSAVVPTRRLRVVNDGHA